jgi:hypothetical protein
MKKSILVTVLVVIGLQLSCSQLKSNDIDKTVIDFVHLLVSDEVISLSDYAKFYGQSSEQELFFELRRCKERGWDVYSDNCISYTRKRWDSPEKEKSLFIDWIKEEFQTAGKNYEFINSKSSAEGFEHTLIEVLIGDHKYTLFQNRSLHKITGVLIGISSIDNRSVQSYLSDS